MTREEAIEFGNIWLQINEDCKDSSTYEFFQMAIKALEQEPCEDCISRAELLKAIDTWDKFGVDDTNHLFRLDNLSLPYYVPYIHYDDVIKCIKGMPSVKQELTTEWINGYMQGVDNMSKEFKHECKKCKEEQELKTVVTENTTSDCISRQAVLKLFATHDGKYLYEAIRDMPSVEQEPKTEWIPVSERLPKKDGEYLITDDGIVMTLDYSNKYGWYYDDGEHFQKFDDVTAWLPLPEPYKMESEG